MAKAALFIGRFQPFHTAHLSDVRLALKESGKVIIAVGSSQESGTRENPFTYEERKAMIADTLKVQGINNFDIVPVPDINDDKKWVTHVEKTVPDFDIVYTGNSFTEKLFKEKNVDVRKITLIPHINATEIRRRILHGGNWKELVPLQVANHIEKVNGAERIRNIKSFSEAA